MLNEFAQLVVNLIGIGYFSMTFTFLTLIMRIVTKKRWLIQMITIKKGTYEYETISIDAIGDIKHGNKTVKESQLYRDKRPRKWWLWYWVSNCRGKYVTVLDEEGNPIEYSEPKVSGDIIAIARKSDALTKAVDTTFDKGNPNGKTIMIILLLIFLIIVMVIIYRYMGSIDMNSLKLF